MPISKSKVFSFISSLLKDKNQQSSFFYIVLRGISVICNYFFSILVIRLFSKDDYGNYVYGLSVFMLLSIFLKFGIDVHFVKIFSESRRKLIPRWISILERKITFIALIVCGVLISILYLFKNEYPISIILIFFVLSVPFYVKVLLNSGKLRGVSEILKFAFLNIAGRVLLSLLVFLILYFLLTIKSSNVIFYSHLTAIVILALVSYIWINRKFDISKPDVNSEAPKNFFQYNKGLLIKSYATVLFLWGDRFFLSLISDSSQVAQYDVALKIAMLIMIVSEALKSTYAPVFAKYTKEKSVLQAEVRRSTRVGFSVSFIVLVLIVLFGKLILRLFGPEFEESYIILLVISFGYTIASFFGQADNIIEMCGLIKYYVKFYFTIIILALIIGVILALNFGALGMAVGFASGNILFQLAAFYIVRMKLNIKTSFL